MIQYTILFSSGSNDVKETTTAVDMTTFSLSDWNALTNSTDAHFLVETITHPTHADILTKVAADTTYWNETPSTTYIYELNMVTKNVGDTVVVQFNTYPNWAETSFTDIMTTVDPNNTPTIQQYIEPIIQPIIQDSLLCNGSVNSFVHQDIGSTTKYSIARSVIFGKAMSGRRRATYNAMQTNIINMQITSKTAEIAFIASYKLEFYAAGRPTTATNDLIFYANGKAIFTLVNPPDVWEYHSITFSCSGDNLMIDVKGTDDGGGDRSTAIQFVGLFNTKAPDVNLLSNPQFSEPVLQNNTYTYTFDITDWTGTAVHLNNSAAWGFPRPYPIGDQAISIQKTEHINQVILTQTGTAAGTAAAPSGASTATKTLWGQVWAAVSTDESAFTGSLDFVSYKTTLEADLATMITTTGTTTTINPSYVLDDNLTLAVVPTGSTLETLISIYTAFTAMTVNPKVYLLGYEWNVQTKRINITRNPNIQKCFQYINDMTTYFNAIKYVHNQTEDTFSYGFDGIKTPISQLLTTYPTLATNLYMYTYIAPTVENGVMQALVASTTTVSKVGIGDDYSIQLIGGTPVQISDETSTTVKQMHTNLINEYNNKQLPLGEYGVLQFKGDGNQSYYFLTYQYSENQVLGVFVDMATDFITSSVQLTGDMNIEGQLAVKDGIWLGGKLLRVSWDGNGLMWGDKTVNLT